MAKSSETFFIRAEVTVPADESVVEQDIDLGAFVNLAMPNSTLLKINGVSVAYQDGNGLVPALDASASGWANYVLATQSSSTMTRLSDRSVIASGGLTTLNTLGSVQTPGQATEHTDINPATFPGGYLVGVDTIYLRGAIDNAWNESIYISIVMEVQTVKSTQSRANALALSQQ